MGRALLPTNTPYTHWLEAALSGGFSYVLAPHRIEGGQIIPATPEEETPLKRFEFKDEPEIYTKKIINLQTGDLDEILGFVDAYGLPNSAPDDQTIPPIVPGSMGVEAFRSQIDGLRKAVEMYNDEIWPTLSLSDGPNFKRYMRDTKLGAKRRNLFNAAQHRVFDSLQRHVQQAWGAFAKPVPRLTIGEGDDGSHGVAEEWVVSPPYRPTLLQIAWLQFYRDILAGYPMRRCDRCNRIFVRQERRPEAADDPRWVRADAKFCSKRCGNAESARRRRERDRKAKASAAAAGRRGKGRTRS